MSTFCILPFISLHYKCGGESKVCCNSSRFLSEGYDSNIWNSKEISLIRNDLENNIKSENCLRCFNEEREGKYSKRIHSNDYYKSFKFIDQPQILHLNFGIECNLACRTCNPYTSSTWINEALYFSSDKEKREIIENQSNIKKFYSNNNFYKQIYSWLPKIKEIEFLGGEPFLIKKMWDMLHYMIDHNLAKDIELIFTTNGTIYKNIDVLKKFKKVTINISVDGICEQFEYLRYPAKWSKVYKNIQKFFKEEDFNLTFVLTVSSINIYYIDRTIEFLNQFTDKIHLNVVYFPEYFSIINLPTKIKNIVKSKLPHQNNNYEQEQMNSISNIMYSKECNVNMFDKFVQNIKLHDDYRHQSFEKIFPEYYEYIISNSK